MFANVIIGTHQQLNKDGDGSLFLRRALRGNAVFSTLSAGVLVAGSSVLGPWLGIPTLALVVVGLGLLPFALFLERNVRRSEVDPGEARLAVAGDVAWVVGSVALLLFDPIGLTTAGQVAVIAVALVVADFAVLQAIGLGRLRRMAAAIA